MSSHFPGPTTCSICGRQTDDFGTCRCLYRENKPMPEKKPAALALRGLADRYQLMADEFQAIGRYAEAESHRRLVRECLVAAEETEAKLAQMELSECQDGAEEFEGDEQ
jgi:hypothetical protein